jgi:murein L,D-transpeptidase YcbB/YkuD
MLRMAVAVTLVMAARASVAHAAQPPAVVVAPDSVERAARHVLVASARHAAMRWSRLDDVRHSLRTLYDSATSQPLWLRDGRPTPQAHALLTVLADAAAYGLNPTDFDAGRLPAQATWLVTPDHRASFDVAMSANAMRFVRAIAEGRVVPSEAHASLRIPRAPLDVVEAVRELATADDVVATVRSHEPTLVHYARVKESLARFRALAAESSLMRLPALPSGKSVRAGDTWEGTPRLVRLLAALGDAPVAPSNATPADSLRLSPEVIDALRRFQTRTGLVADGVLGRATFATLTRPVTEKVRALELTLERIRWLPRTFDAPPLIVNVPAFRLYVFTGDSDDEANLLRMDVVVGQAEKTETPLFSDTLTTIAFSPYWDVPRSILRKEILPAARRSATYLSRNHYEAVRGERDDSPVIGNGAAALAALEAGAARLRQTPGAHNSLGRVKFLFPNEYNVYLHDTPAQSVFERARRDASHGCIRIADPVGLAKLLLADQPEWTDERIAEAMSRPDPLYVQLRQPRPVFILYATAMATQDGETRFYPDIYGFDDDLARRIAAGFPYTRESTPRPRR